MSFRFIHTADWQIGQFEPGRRSRFGEKAAVLREARLTAVANVAALARSSGAAHVLVAGDVYDQDTTPEAVLQEPLAIMARARDLAWHIIPGNHDKNIPGGPWARAIGAGLPENVVVHLEPEPHELAPGVVLLPAPVAAISMAGDPSAWMDDATTPDGTIRIGLAHGSIKGFDGEGEADILLDAGRAKLAGLSYLALGDWHGTKEIGPHTWYSGAPEPERFRDNDPGHALCVEIDGAGTVPRVARHVTRTYTWVERRVPLAQAGDLEAALREVLAGVDNPRTLLLRLKLEGIVPIAAHRGVAAALDGVRSDVFWLEADSRDLATAVSASDLDASSLEGELRLAADHLLARMNEREGDEARAAGQALQLLFAHGAGGAGTGAGS